MTAGPKGVCVNAVGTNFMNYPGFKDSVGANDPEVFEQILQQIPLRRLGEPSEAAHFTMSLLDGRNMYQTGNFIWAPSKTTTIGAEYLWGRRENKDGASGTANRFLSSSRFDF
jgi:NAD(P)-dependent dehydrogenase (short-subunit alcohol dehydrogenase family)